MIPTSPHNCESLPSEVSAPEGPQRTLAGRGGCMQSAFDCKTCPITQELDALFSVSQVLAHSLDLQKTLSGVLQELHERGGLTHGMVTLLNPESGELILRAVHNDSVDGRKLEEIRYRAGEGVVGHILETGETVVVQRIANEPRFIGRLGVYDQELPFVGT